MKLVKSNNKEHRMMRELCSLDELANAIAHLEKQPNASL